MLCPVNLKGQEWDEGGQVTHTHPTPHMAAQPYPEELTAKQLFPRLSELLLLLRPQSNPGFDFLCNCPTRAVIHIFFSLVHHLLTSMAHDQDIWLRPGAKGKDHG